MILLGKKGLSNRYIIKINIIEEGSTLVSYRIFEITTF